MRTNDALKIPVRNKTCVQYNTITLRIGAKRSQAGYTSQWMTGWAVEHAGMSHTTGRK